ncbi:MAG: patatin-like phospholipase family protein [Polyangiales bacterium]
MTRVQTLQDWLAEAPFRLVMSSGFFGFYAHAGVLCALEEARLLPSSAAGASAGALVTGAFCAGVSSRELRERLTILERHEFWDPAWGPGLLRGQRVIDVLQSILPVETFAQCRIPVAMSTFDVARRRTHVLDSGPLAPAIAASCAVPLMFQPVRHMGRALYDGGILDRPGLAGVAHHERVFYHHLSSRWLGYTIPRRRDLVALEIASLPQVDPMRMARGRRAMALAAEATRHALRSPAADVIRVDAMALGSHAAAAVA